MKSSGRLIEDINNLLSIPVKYCSECGFKNDEKSEYCIRCEHKLKNIPKNNSVYIYCVYCGKRLGKNDKYCNQCGSVIVERKNEIKVCPVCGEWCDDERYCWNCGHDNFKNIHLGRILSEKKCPNCNSYYDGCYNYCDECGTKLVSK